VIAANEAIVEESGPKMEEGEMEDARSKEVNEDTNSRRCEAEKGKYWEALPEAIIKEE